MHFTPAGKGLMHICSSSSSSSTVESEGVPKRYKIDMDGEVPEFRAAGTIARDVQDTLSIDDYDFTHELLEVLRHDDEEKPAASSSTATNGSIVTWPASQRWRRGSARSSSSSTMIIISRLTRRPPSPEEQQERTGSGSGSGTPSAKLVSSCSGRRRRSCAGKAAEQRRRDKINDKMRTLQQLMPTCTKTDKASTLEEVIRYIKSLQHQMQVLSNGYVTPTAIWPPPCMRPVGDVFSGQAAPMLLPPYPFFPTVFASCPQQSTIMPLNPIVHESASQQQQLVHPHLVFRSDHAVPISHGRVGSRMESIWRLPLEHS